MIKRVVVVAVLVTAGCSSARPPELPPGTLVPGTAQVTVNDMAVGTTEHVQCTTVGWLTIITADYGDSGVTAMVSNKDELDVELVGIDNLGGFTGSYNPGLTGTAKVTLPGSTYDITGTAHGFDTDNPSFPAGGTFAIKASC